MSVSIPFRGCGAFRPRYRSGAAQAGGFTVSIPFRGFGAFRQFVSNIFIRNRVRRLNPLPRIRCLPAPGGPSRRRWRLRKVSIPFRGFGAFRPAVRHPPQRADSSVSIPFRGFGAFRQLQRRHLIQQRRVEVSIPFRGFGAFRPGNRWGLTEGDGMKVSIPFRGFGAFRPLRSPLVYPLPNLQSQSPSEDSVPSGRGQVVVEGQPESG